MQTKAKNRLQVAGVSLIMAGSIVTVVLVAWLGDGRNEPRSYPAEPAIAQSR